MEKAEKNMQVISFVSFKGGSGKTTSAIATASRLVDARKGRVFILDLDEQQTSCYRWLADTRDVYGADAPDKKILDGAKITAGLGNEAAMTEMFGILENASKNYDYCIIDTQGRQTALAIAAIQVSDFVLVPFQISGIELEPFITTYKIAQKYTKVDGAKVLGITTRMPFIASTTMNNTREVLKEYDIDVVHGTQQRDGYQQLVFEAGTFAMIAKKFEKIAISASDGKTKKRAEKEVDKAHAASGDMKSILERIGLIPAIPEKTERKGAA